MKTRRIALAALCAGCAFWAAEAAPFKIMFFDDDLLFERRNVERRYGEVVLAATYRDEKAETVFSSPWTFRLEDGEYRMIYLGIPAGNPQGGKRVLSARSCDGINFVPESFPDRKGDALPNEIMKLGGDEVCFVCDDPMAKDASERYKMAICTVDMKDYRCAVVLHSSPDLVTWKRRDDLPMPLNGEPVMGVVFNRGSKAATILARPWWGCRKVGHVDTADWRSYTPYELALKTDALDAPLAELYGMPAFFHEGVYVGFAHIYSGFAQGMHTKYENGTMLPQLAYSWDAHHWQRSLREPFAAPEACRDYKMIWPTSALTIGDSVYVYAAAAKMEHGRAFRDKNTKGRILVQRVRRDGFVRLAAAGESPGAVATREVVWHGGEFHVNLKAKSATVAVYESSETSKETMNLLGHCRPVKGFGHGDCKPFAGDSTHWTPVFGGGKLDSLKGRTIAFEVKFENGDLYSFSGDMTPVFNIPAERYRKTGRLGVSHTY